MNLATIVLILFNLMITLCEFPKTIWTYWGKGMESHPTIKMYHDNHRRMIENNGWQLRFIDNRTSQKYLKQVPLYSEETYRSLQKMLGPAVLSDYVRCMIMTHYGGLYVDMTTIFFEDLQWLNFDNLHKNPLIINRYGDSPEVVFFTYNQFGDQQKYFDISLNQSFILRPRYEIWFMAAVPNSKFLLQFCPQLTKVYADGGTQWNGYVRYKQRMFKQQNISGDFFSQIPYLVSLDIINIQLLKRQKILDKISQQTNSPRVLPTWYYKAWHLTSSIGPYSIPYYYGWDNYFTFVGLYGQQQISRILHMGNLTYFLKAVYSARESIDNFLLDIPFYDIKRRWRCYFYRDTYCTVYKSSIFYKYLINGSSQYERLFRISDKQYLKESATLRLNDNKNFENVVIYLVVIIFLLFVVIIYLFIKIRSQSNKTNRIKISQNQEHSEIKNQQVENN